MSTPTTTHGGTTTSTTTFSDLDHDIIESHVLTRLDGPTLASASSSSSHLHSLSSSPSLWTDVCHAAFPSLSSSPLILPLFGPCRFFSLVSPLLLPNQGFSVGNGWASTTTIASATSPPPKLMSFVDIFYKGNLIFSKVEEMETVSGWFMCSPFRVDLLDPKDVVSTTARHPDDDVVCESLGKEMSLSWVMVDLEGRRAANFSTHKPVSVERHWLSGEVQVRFATILASANRSSEFVQCAILVTCGASESGEMQVREVSLQMEDMDGTHLVGKDSLVILHRALDGNRGKYKNREEEGKRRYREYLEMKRERKEKKLRVEGTLDSLCVGFGATIFAAFSFWVVSLCSL